MQSAVEIKSDLELKINISVPAKEYQNAYGKKVQEVSKTAKVTGFRPGKVPSAYIKKFYGPSIEAEVIDEMIRTCFDKVCVERKLSVAGIEKVDVTQKTLGKDLEFYVDVEIFPEIKFEDKDFSDININKYNVEITKEDIAESIEKLQKSHANWVDAAKTHKATSGDKVIIDFKGLDSDGKEIKSGSAEDFDLELGSNYLIPGFEDGVVGHKVDDVFELNLKFPDDYHVSEHAGKDVKFVVTLKAIKTPELPKLDADFCAKFGVNLDEQSEPELDVELTNDSSGITKELTAEELEQLKNKLEEKVAESLKLEAKSISNKKYRDDLYQSLREHKKLNLPKALVENEITKLIKHRQDVYRQYTGDKNTTVDLPRDNFTTEAENNIHLMLLVKAYIEQYNIKADMEHIKAKLEEQWGGADKVSDHLIEWYTGDPKRYQQLEAQVLEDLVVANLAQKINIAEKKISFKELVEK